MAGSRRDAVRATIREYEQDINDLISIMMAYYELACRCTKYLSKNGVRSHVWVMQSNIRNVFHNCVLRLESYRRHILKKILDTYGMKRGPMLCIMRRPISHKDEHITRENLRTLCNKMWSERVEHRFMCRDHNTPIVVMTGKIARFPEEIDNLFKYMLEICPICRVDNDRSMAVLLKDVDENTPENTYTCGGDNDACMSPVGAFGPYDRITTVVFTEKRIGEAETDEAVHLMIKGRMYKGSVLSIKHKISQEPNTRKRKYFEHHMTAAEALVEMGVNPVRTVDTGVLQRVFTHIPQVQQLLLDFVPVEFSGICRVYRAAFLTKFQKEGDRVMVRELAMCGAPKRPFIAIHRARLHGEEPEDEGDLPDYMDAPGCMGCNARGARAR
jgi:hypothetical protein